MIDIESVLEQLAGERPIFHSEADFQHALAWKLHERFSDYRIRLEYRPFLDERIYLDIWMAASSGSIALELKYLTRRITIKAQDETYALRDQAAQDISRYDFIKDLARLEAVTEAGKAAMGYAVLLTNDSGYWKPSNRPNPVDAAFRLHEGRSLEGNLAWSTLAGPGTTQARETPHSLRGKYLVHWIDYSNVGAVTNGRFRYLLIPVTAGGEQRGSSPGSAE